MRKLLYLIASIAVALPLLTGCLGPKPVVLSHKDEAPPAGSDQPFRVEVVIANQGPGDGQVEVEVNLRDKRNNETISQNSSNVQLKKDEVQHVLFSIDLPPSAKDIDSKDIDVEVDAHYPIE
ncbi:MAG: hypothetical protein M3014_09195 [Chloroflexota bacterium]|nr:hypothetical protein [Chloroflexota bacterium]